MSEQDQKIDFQKKWEDLWAEKRVLRIRMRMAILCAFAFTFTFIVFGPCEIYAGNPNDMPFSFSALAPMLILVGTAVFLSLLGILFLLRGKVYDIAISLLFAVTAAGYIQGNFLNLNHGTLDGKEIRWLYYKWPMIGDLLFWFLVFGVVFALLYFSQKMWRQVIYFVSVLLIIMQSVAMVSLVISADLTWEDPTSPKLYVSRQGIYELAPKNNVIVFLLDRFDNRWADEALELHPEWREELRGFTYYHNFTGSYANTRPAITYLLTGVQHDYTTDWSGYFRKAWSAPVYPLLKDIHKAGYQTKVYTEKSAVFGDATQVGEFIDNIRPAEETIIYRKKMLTKMLDLSAYRYFPEALKPYFRIYTGEMSDIVMVEKNGGEDSYSIDDAKFWERYREQGLTIDQTAKGAFVFYHLNGAHDPFNLDENANYLAEGATLQGQISGNMNMIFQYIRALKEKGVYENTTIIITTDHARPPWGDFDQIFESRVSTLMIKPSGDIEEEPLKVSNKQVCQDNLRASFISYLGLETKNYGRTIESVGEDESMSRILWVRGEKDELINQMFTFQIVGDANNFSNWKLVNQTEMLYPQI